MATAFVICQVGTEDSNVRKRADEIYNYIVKPVVAEHNLTPTRSDLDATPGQVTAQIIQSLTSAAVIIADLTGRNPNVYYELGVAHSFGKPVVILVDSVESLSFDTAQERVIEIGTGERLGVEEAEKAKLKLREAMQLVLDPDYRPSSLVSDAAGTQSLDALAPENPIAQELAHMRERLELVVRQTAQETVQDDFEPIARSLYRAMLALGRRGGVTTATMKAAGLDATKLTPNPGINTALSDAIKAPQKTRSDLPLDISDFGPPSSAPADDDIPF
jgi:nucleoside 2-deoxyribosyltransferase